MGQTKFKMSSIMCDWVLQVRQSEFELLNDKYNTQVLYCYGILLMCICKKVAINEAFWHSIPLKLMPSIVLRAWIEDC